MCNLPEAHAILGVVAGMYDHDWSEQDRQFQLALAREPVASDVYGHYGVHCLLLTDRPAEGAQALRSAFDRDPLNLILRVQRAICLDASGDAEQADAELREVLELNPQCGPAAEWLALHRAFRERWDDAVTYAEQAFTLAGQCTRFTGLLAGSLYRAGEKDGAGRLMATLGSGEAYGAPVELMIFNLLQPRMDEAAAWAERAIEQRDGYMLVLLSTLVGTALRSSAYWPALARRLNRPPV